MRSRTRCIERRGHVLIVTMNRPAGAQRAQRADDGPDAPGLGQVDSDPAIRVCVLTGAGGAFCAGADLKAMTSATPATGSGPGTWTCR